MISDKWFMVYTVGDMMSEAGSRIQGGEVVLMLEIALIGILALMLQWILGWLGLGKWAKYVYITGGLLSAKMVFQEVWSFLAEVIGTFG